MSNSKTQLLQAGLDFLYGTRLHKLLQPLSQGSGLILALHQVRPKQDEDDFHPNAILEVTPKFLDLTLSYLKQNNFDLVSLNEALKRLKEGQDAEQNRFAAITLDDGYQDNIDYALPVFEKHACPFTIYTPTDYIEGKGILWWLALEKIIASQNKVTFQFDGHKDYFSPKLWKIRRRSIIISIGMCANGIKTLRQILSETFVICII
jgi:peptidoglycan/xylan/chitin deacetylase (PgdA/CDA1 family)